MVCFNKTGCSYLATKKWNSQPVNRLNDELNFNIYWIHYQKKVVNHFYLWFFISHVLLFGCD